MNGSYDPYPDFSPLYEPTSFSWWLFSTPNEAGHAVLFDLIHLKDGRVLCVDNEGVILYEDDDLLHSDAIESAGAIDLTVVPDESSES